MRWNLHCVASHRRSNFARHGGESQGRFAKFAEICLAHNARAGHARRRALVRHELRTVCAFASGSQAGCTDQRLTDGSANRRFRFKTQVQTRI